GALEDGECFGGFESGDGFLRDGQRLDAAVAEPAVIVGGVSGCVGGLEVTCVGEVEHSFVEAGVLELVDVAAEEGEGDGAGDVDPGILELAVDEDGDGNESAGGGLGEVAGPLVDADGADDLLRLGDLVHLCEGREGREGSGCEDRAEEVGSHSLLSRLDAIGGAKSYLEVRS